VNVDQFVSLVLQEEGIEEKQIGWAFFKGEMWDEPCNYAKRVFRYGEVVFEGEAFCWYDKKAGIIHNENRFGTGCCCSVGDPHGRELFSILI